jgi:uncharacterized LabA/DUF88 family protein
MPTLNDHIADLLKGMVFVDGENLAIRYGSLLKKRNVAPKGHVVHVANVLAWSSRLHSIPAVDVIRRYYYTSVQGDDPLLADTEKELKEAGIEAPRVFRKDKTKGSKRVDITLATDMLLYAARKHYNIAFLVAGDEDYVPLVQAVQFEGARVHVWFVPDGISPALQHAADSYVDLDPFLFQDT